MARRPNCEIFISYSRANRYWADQIYSELETLGHHVFMDVRGLSSGDAWANHLEEKIIHARMFVIIIGLEGIHRWVRAELSIALNHYYEQNGSAFSIHPVLVDGASCDLLPPLLRTFHAIEIKELETISAGVELLTSKANSYSLTQAVLDINPFVGLSSFGREHSHIFFGRNREINELLNLISPSGEYANTTGRQRNNRASRWLQIDGASGSGKSSIIAAGLIPEIEKGALCWRSEIDSWKIIGPIVPGAQPVERLAEAIAKAIEQDPARRDMAAMLSRFTNNADKNTKALAYALRSYAPERGGFVLIVDQFEELYFLSDSRERIIFDQLLASAVRDGDCPLILISAIRSDFIHLIGNFLPNLAGLYNAYCARYLLRPIDVVNLRDSIVRRASMCGVNAEDLADVIIKDVAGDAGALPLVESCLSGLWDVAKKSGHFSIKRYFASGGVAGAIASHGDELLSSIERELNGGSKDCLELLLALTNVNPDGTYTRRRLSWEECVSIAGNGNHLRGIKIVSMLCGSSTKSDIQTHMRQRFRVLQVEQVAGADGIEQSVSLIHEALVRNRNVTSPSEPDQINRQAPYWPTLAAFLEKNRGRASVFQQLQRKVDLWQNSSWWRGRRHLATKNDLIEYKSIRIPPSKSIRHYIRSSRVRLHSWKIILLIAVTYQFKVIPLFLYEVSMIPIIYIQYALHVHRWENGEPPPIPEVVQLTIPDAGLIAEIGCKVGRDIPETANQKDVSSCASKIVTNRTFCRVGATEVSNLEFAAFLFFTRGHKSIFHRPSDIERVDGAIEGIFMRGFSLSDQFISESSPSLPITNVTHGHAEEYIRWLNKETGRRFRLLTQEEWEIVYRYISDDRKFPWSENSAVGRANCAECDHFRTFILGLLFKDSVRSYGPYRGIYNLTGNVAEWTSTEDGVGVPGSKDPDDQLYKIVGGSYLSSAHSMTPMSNNAINAGARRPDVGFRVCEDIASSFATE